jgi:hypothetical protein
MWASFSLLQACPLQLRKDYAAPSVPSLASRVETLTGAPRSAAIPSWKRAMIHHVSLGTGDVERARRFYDPVMDLLGLRMLECEDSGVHYGTGKTFFSLVVPTNGKAASGGNGTHIAFAARDRTMVEEFHTTALRHGGRSAQLGSVDCGTVDSMPR